MRRCLLSLAILFAGCAKQAPTLAADAPVSDENAVEADSEEQARPLTMWQVDKDGMETSYLFGTCHMGVSVQEALPAEYEPYLTDADLFVMEVDPGTMFNPDVIARMQLTDGQTMTGLMGEEDWQAVLQEFDLQENAAALDRLHPYVVLTQLSSVVQVRHNPEYNGAGGMMDLGLSSMAQQSGRQQAWLEDVHDQLDVLLGQPMDEYVDGIRELRDPEVQEQSVASMTAMLDLCRTGDIEPALAVMDSDDSDLMDTLLIQRNRNWIPVLEDYFSRGSVFVAAGAGHMIGEDSVVSMLTDKGYTVTRLSGVTRPPSTENTLQAGLPREAFTQVMGTQLATVLCSEAQPLTRCFDVDAATCATTFTEVASTCQDLVELPIVVPTAASQEWGGKLGGCMSEQFAATHADRLIDDPACAPFAGTRGE